MDVNSEAAERDILLRELERAADLSEWLETASTEDVIRYILEEEEKQRTSFVPKEEHEKLILCHDAMAERAAQSPRQRLIEDCRRAESPGMVQAICFGNLVEFMDKAAQPKDTTFDMVAAFNEKFGLGYAGQPRMLPPALRKLKENHLHEELVEYKKALASGDLEECLDALIDLVYVALGAAYMHGFDFNEGFKRVHAVNMKKERARAKHHSKRKSEFDVVKPEGWKPAYLGDLI